MFCTCVKVPLPSRIDVSRQLSMVRKKMGQCYIGFPQTHRWISRKSKKTREEKNHERFNLYFGCHYGEQWDGIYRSLMRSSEHCFLCNKYGSPNLPNIFKSVGATHVLYDVIASLEPRGSVRHKCNSASVHHAEEKAGTSQLETKLMLFLLEEKQRYQLNDTCVNQGSVLDYYLLDLSSVIPVIALDLEPHSYVLDMCAAPGGKSLAVLQLLGRGGHLVMNDISPARRKRIFKVLKEYLPAPLRYMVTVTEMDGQSFGKDSAKTFDRILVDAPCSAERHVLRDGFFATGWSETKCREYANLQHSLLMSALEAVVVGGIVVYCTCSICHMENDQVVERTLDKCQEIGLNVELVDCLDLTRKVGPELFNTPIKHGLGVTVLPSLGKNWGPMYVCKLRKSD